MRKERPGSADVKAARAARAIGAFLAVGLLAAVAHGVGAATIVGQTGDGILVNGYTVPSGTTLLATSELRTTDTPGVIHLNDGRALVLSASSRARLAAGEDGSLRVAVDEGVLAMRQGEETITIASNETLVLDEPVGEGARVEGGKVDVCLLWKDLSAKQPLTDQAAIRRCIDQPGDCQWELKRGAARSQTQAWEAQGYLLIDAAGDPNVVGRLGGANLDADDVPGACQAALAGVTPGGGGSSGGGGLSTGAKVGIGLGVAAAGVIIYEETNNDEEEGPASP